MNRVSSVEFEQLHSYLQTKFPLKDVDEFGPGVLVCAQAVNWNGLKLREESAGFALRRFEIETFKVVGNIPTVWSLWEADTLCPSDHSDVTPLVFNEEVLKTDTEYECDPQQCRQGRE